MSAEMDPVKVMKQEVGKAAAALVKSGTIVGLGTGSTTAYAIEYLGKRLQSGELKDIKRHSHLLSSRSPGKTIWHSFNNFGCR